MSGGEFKSCLDCAFYRTPQEGDGPWLRHLCTLPRECAPPPPEGAQSEHNGPDGDGLGREYLGTVCDVMRRMGALCGPRAALWRAKA